MGKLDGVSADAMEKLRQSVRRGAALLDGEAERDDHLVPKNWRELLDRSGLRMSDAEACVLGQIAAVNGLNVADYVDMCCVLDLDQALLIEHGFVAGQFIKYDYGLLTLVWQQYLGECSAV